MRNLKRSAKEHPDQPPAQILRTQLRNAPSGSVTLENNIDQNGTKFEYLAKLPDRLKSLYP